MGAYYYGAEIAIAKGVVGVGGGVIFGGTVEFFDGGGGVGCFYGG